MNKLLKRKNIRLKEYDYSKPGYYFITICTKDKKNFFWNCAGATCGRQWEKPPLSKLGKIVDKEINRIASIYDNVEINKYVIMPNHIHLIIVLHNESGQTGISGRPQVAPTIARIVQQFKGSISKQVGFSIWQKSYYDHVIRNQIDYLKIREYIDTNPMKWAHDKYYVQSQ